MHKETRNSFISLVTGLLLGLAIFAGLKYFETKPDKIIKETRVERKESQPILKNPLLEEGPAEQNEQSIAKRLYKGYWFDIEYPENFSVSPTEPINYHEGVRMILTDQAYFTSPDNTVEFYVYSPLWYGSPEYIEMLSTEELIDEEIQESDHNRVTFRTYREKNGAYFRSYAFYENNLIEGEDISETSHVFGVKYSSKDSYTKYKQDYAAFKQSLNQYAD